MGGRCEGEEGDDGGGKMSVREEPPAKSVS